jgi:hypothetical protein
MNELSLGHYSYLKLPKCLFCYFYMPFKGLTAVNLKNRLVFRIMTTCNLLDIYGRFVGICCLFLNGIFLNGYVHSGMFVIACRRELIAAAGCCKSSSPQLKERERVTSPGTRPGFLRLTSVCSRGILINGCLTVFAA